MALGKSDYNLDALAIGGNMVESEFIKTAMAAASEVLVPPLVIKPHSVLLYQITVDNRLSISVNPRDPKRGQSAFQTDLCIFEEVEEGITIPRVVVEFKPDFSTHDILIYSAKARKHKHVYPYLRYGLVMGDLSTIPGRFFTHNEGLDFAVAAAPYKKNRFQELFTTLMTAEVATSRRLEDIGFGEHQPRYYRSELIVEENGGKIV